MADRTHSTASSHSIGDLTLAVIRFTDIDTGDTYSSGIPSAVAYWANGTDDPTQNLETVGVKYEMDIPGGAKNAGRFTFVTEEADRAVALYVLSRT